MTKAVVGYMKNENEFRGTYVHWDGDNVPGILGKWMPAEQDAIVAWVENGIAKGGYHSAGEDSATFDEGEKLFTDILETFENVPYVYLVENGNLTDVFAHLD